MHVLPGLYSHWKGGTYEVLGECLDKETGEINIVYRSTENPRLWTRNLSNFLETVTREGKEIPRFIRIGDCDSTEGRLAQVEETISQFINRQGHDRCHYYPELLEELAGILKIKQTTPSNLPTLEEFKAGCERFQREQYGKKPTS